MTVRQINPLSREQFIEILLSKSNFNKSTELVTLEESVGRITSKEIYSLNTLPNESTSSIDGIGVKFDKILYEDYIDTSNWILGEDYVFCNTGVSMPRGYDTAIPIEVVSFNEKDKIIIKKLPNFKGERVNPKGSIMEVGDRIIPANYFITPYQLGVIASAGIEYIEVTSKPKVAVIPTGDELISSGITLKLGKNIETNSIVLKSLIKEWGGEPLIYPITPDNPEKLLSVLKQATDEADIVIFNAGSSKGEQDYTIDVLNQAGKVIVEELGYGPARPTSFAIANGIPVLGLVGPPIGAELTARWYIQPMIDFYLEQPISKSQTLRVELIDFVSSPIPLDFYAQMIIKKIDSKYIAKQVLSNRYKSSRVKLSVESNAILYIPKGKSYYAGDMVVVELKVPIEYIN